MIECYYHLEDWKSLESMIDSLQEADPLLELIGDMFASSAVHTEAVKAYVKVGKMKSAINVCILHNRWDVAIDLAKTYNITKISELLMKYTIHLVEQGQIMNAIQVNVQAKCYLEAAEHAFKVIFGNDRIIIMPNSIFCFALQLADLEAQKPNKNLLKIKKHYVYAAKLTDLYKKPAGSGK